MPLRTGFAGLGRVGSALLAAAAGVPELQPVAVQDPAAPALAAATQRAPGLAAFTDYEALLETAGLDAVVVSPPTAYHGPYARMALARGIHVLLQPPLARTGPEADPLLDLAATADAWLVLDFPWRQAPATAAARAALAAGRLGTLLSVQARFHNLAQPHAAWMRDRAWAGGGALIDQGTPLLDLLLYLLDFPPAAVSAAYLWRAGQPPGAGVEDFATLLGTVGGAPLHCEVSWGAALPRTAVSVTLFGTAGSLVWHNAQGRLDTFTARLGRPGAEDALGGGPYDPAIAGLQAFAARCATPPWSASLAPYRAVTALIDQAYTSDE